MKMCKAWLLVVLACLLLPADGQPQEGVGETVIVDEAVDEQKPLEPASATSHFQEPVHDSQDTHLKEKFEGRNTAQLDNPSAQTEHSTENGQTRKSTAQVIKEDWEGAADTFTEESEGTEMDSAVDADPGGPQGKEMKRDKVVLEAFGDLEDESEEEASESPGEGQREEDVWTEQTEEGAEQKRTGGRRFFSLMNLIKFLLNPVFEEFQMEKSTSNSDAPAAPTTTTASAVNSDNKSEVGGASTGNSSEVAEKDEKKNGTDSGKKTKFQCVGKNVTENATATVRVVNSTVLLELLSFDKNHSTSDCVLVMFYAPWCHFCAATAPHYNAVARAFPQLEVLAVDTVHFSNLNARFGTVAVPNIMLFHQSRSAVRFNHTERHFQTLVQFITNTTGLEANSTVELSAEDYDGPLSSTPTEEIDYLLWFAWVFIIVCSGHIFISSQLGQLAIERVNVLWQEHQHQHIE